MRQTKIRPAAKGRRLRSLSADRHAREGQIRRAGWRRGAQQQIGSTGRRGECPIEIPLFDSRCASVGGERNEKSNQHTANQQIHMEWAYYLTIGTASLCFPDGTNSDVFVRSRTKTPPPLFGVR